VRWRVQARSVGSRNGYNLSWTLDAAFGPERYLVTAESSHDGQVADIQCGARCGTTGNPDLDAIVIEKIEAAVRMHDVMRDLDATRQPSHRRARET
jgi:hypothetical protein